MEIIGDLNMDEIEQVALLFLMLQRVINVKVGAQPKMQEISNQIFRELKVHYIETYNDVALRFDRLILWIQRLEVSLFFALFTNQSKPIQNV
jgi:hypothetical protein